MTGTTPSIKKNLVYNTLYQILLIAIPLITTPYVTRVLGAYQIGIQSYTASIASYFTLFASMGKAYYGQREISIVRDDQYVRSKKFWEIELLTAGTTGLVLTAWFLLILLSSKYRLYFMILSISIASTAFDISWLFIGLEDFLSVVVRNTLIRSAGLICVITLVRSPDDLALFMTINSIVLLVSNLTLWPVLRKYIQRVHLKDLQIFSHMKGLFVFFLPSIAISIYTVLDKTMIGFMVEDKAVSGYYDLSINMIRMFETMLFSLNTVMASRMAYLYSQDRISEMNERVSRSLDFLILIAIPSAFGMAGIAAGFVDWYFGEGYHESSILIGLLSPLIVIVCISSVLEHQYITPIRQKRKSNIIIIIGAFLNFSLNILLIPRFEAEGAAVASVVAEAVISCLYLYISRGFITILMLWRICRKRLLAALSMFAIIMIVGKASFHGLPMLVLQVLAGATMYFLSLIVLKDKTMVNYIKKYRIV